MALIYTKTLTADGNFYFDLPDLSREKANQFTAYVYGGFGSGTFTAFTNPAGTAADGTTNDIAITDQAGAAISRTTKGAFNFVAGSDNSTNKVQFKGVLASSTNPSLVVRVYSI